MTIDARDGRWARAGRLARWLLGAFSLVGGLTWILFTAHGPTALLDLTVGVVLAAASPAAERTCCAYAYVLDRGFPFAWVQRAGVGADPATAERLAGSAHWTIDLVSLAVDLLLWAYAGMLLVVIAELVRRRRG